MPVNLADLDKAPNPPLLKPGVFKAGEKLTVNPSDQEERDLLDVLDMCTNVVDMHNGASDGRIVPSIAYVMSKGIDFRSIFTLFISLKQPLLAIDFLKYLEKNEIFLPIALPYSDDQSCSNFFTSIAAFNDSSVTQHLFQHGIDGFKKHLKAERSDISEAEVQAKVRKYVEDLLAINPVSGRLSTLEYIISTISPVGLVNEGFVSAKTPEQLRKLKGLAYEMGGSREGIGNIDLQYNLPWNTIKMLIDIADEYSIDLREQRSRRLEHGEKIFDILEKAIGSVEGMNKLVNKFRLPYANVNRKIQKTEVEAYGPNKQDFFYTLDVDPMHYDAEPSSIVIVVSHARFKKSLETIMAKKTPALSEAVEERLRRHSADLGQQRQDLRRHSGDMSSIKTTVERHDREIETLKLDMKDLKQDAAKLKGLVERHLADELIFENLGDNEFLRHLYVEVRDAIIYKLNDALQGNPDKQFDLLCKNAAILGGAADFAAGFAGAPGVIGASFNIIIFASRYFKKLDEKRVSKEMQEFMLGSLDLPKLIAIGVAEAVALKAKENIHGRKFKSDEQKHMIKCIEELVHRQLSGRHLDKLFEILGTNRTDLFETIKEILVATIIEGKPFTAPFLAKGVGFSSDHKEMVHHKHSAHDLVKSLLNPTKVPPELAHYHSDEDPSVSKARAASGSGSASTGRSSPTSTSENSGSRSPGSGHRPSITG